ESGLIDMPRTLSVRSSSDFDAIPTAFDGRTGTPDDAFGAETSQDVPRLPDPDAEETTTGFCEQTLADSSFRALKPPISNDLDPEEGSNPGLIEGSGFGDKTVADPAFRALGPKHDTLPKSEPSDDLDELPSHAVVPVEPTDPGEEEAEAGEFGFAPTQIRS